MSKTHETITDKIIWDGLQVVTRHPDLLERLEYAKRPSHKERNRDIFRLFLSGQRSFFIGKIYGVSHFAIQHLCRNIFMQLVKEANKLTTNHS